MSKASLIEKVWIADQIAEGFRATGMRPQTIGFQPERWTAKIVERNYSSASGPVIIVGYAHALNNACVPSDAKMAMLTLRDGVVYFSGRSVDCIINERFAHLIQEKRGAIDFRNTMIGPMIDLGLDKAFGYALHDEFIRQPGVQDAFPALNRKMHHTLCHSVEALIQTARSRARQGLGFVCKPSGITGGHGVIAVRPGECDDNALYAKIGLAIAELGRLCESGDDMAGMPYVVSDYIESLRIRVPYDLSARYGHLNGCEFELRIGISKLDMEGGRQQLVAAPHVFKIFNARSHAARSADSPLHKAHTGQHFDECILPALNDDAMRLTGIGKSDLFEAAKFSAAHQVHVLQGLSRKAAPADLHQGRTHTFRATAKHDAHKPDGRSTTPPTGSGSGPHTRSNRFGALTSQFPPKFRRVR